MKCIFLSCLLLVQAGCAVAPGKASDAGLIAAEMAVPDESAAGVEMDKSVLTPSPAEPTATTRKIIYTADFLVRIMNPDMALDRTRQIATDLAGFVQEESTGMIRFRIPAERFRDAVKRISEIGRILERQVSASDVTEEYQDLEIRLAVKTKFLAELQELYDKGGSLKDLLEIKREIDKVTEEIERLKGRLRFLTNRIAFSTITVRFRVATRLMDRHFRLPFSWLDDLGIDVLLSR